MNYAENWNYIVLRHKELYNSTENLIQREWEDYFSEIFGYKRILGEIDSQRTINFGTRERGIPDIIIKTSGQDLFDVELKQYNLPFSQEMKNQLISYLRQLRLSVGILICQKIYVCVYDYKNDTVKKLEIPFVENNPEGIKFIELLQKGNFSVEQIEDFINSKNNFSNNVNKIKSELTSENILELVKLYFEGTYSGEEIDTALQDVLITVTSKTIIEPPKEPGSGVDKPGGGSGMDYSQYCFEGKIYGKGRLVLAVVKAYVRDNPYITYTELENVFYKKLQGSHGVISIPNSARNRVQDPEKRYYTDDPIYLKDMPIWVCSQWGIGNINNFIDKAKFLGYKIDLIGK